MCEWMDRANALISIRQLSFSYRGAERPAVNAIDLEIQDGEIVAILGANGSGKSTLARMIGGLLRPKAGEVVIDGVSTASPPRDWFVHQHVGMVFQNPQNQIVSTVVENEVAFGLENLLFSSAEMQRRVEECLSLVGLSHLQRANPHELSAGEQQRLAIASALAARPKHLLLDEATSLLDDRSRLGLMQTVQQLARDLRLAVVLITHRMDEVSIADRVIVLSHGEMVFSGTARALFAQPDLLNGWNLALPPLQDLAVQLRDAGLVVTPGAGSVRELADQLWR